MRHNPDRGIMADLVESGPVPVYGLEIGLRGWNLHEVVPRIIERPFSADAEIYTSGPDQHLGPRKDKVSFDRRRDRHDLLRQAFALRHVENGETLEERDRLRFVAGLCGATAFVIRREPVGIYDSRAALAFAHIPIEAEGLTKGQPALARKAMFDDGTPQNEHVNSGVAP